MNEEELTRELIERMEDRASLSYRDYDDLVECHGVDEEVIIKILDSLEIEIKRENNER